MNKETIKRQTGGGKLPNAEKAGQSMPDYFRVTVTGIRVPAGTVGYRVPSTLYDGTKLSMMLWQERQRAMDREYKNALHRYVAAYIDLNHASLAPDEESAADAIGQFYQAADELSRKKEEKYGSFEIPNLDEMLNRDEKVNRLALSRIRAAVKKGCAGMEQLEEMEEAYSYAMFLERGKIKEEIPS